jgi:hypothetical protein
MLLPDGPVVELPGEQARSGAPRVRSGGKGDRSYDSLSGNRGILLVVVWCVLLASAAHAAKREGTDWRELAARKVPAAAEMHVAV